MMAAMATTGLRTMRIQLPGLFRTPSSRQSEERLNLCVPGGKETARMLKALHEELEQSAPRPRARRRLPDRRRCRLRGRAAPARRALARQSPTVRRLPRATRLNKPGSEKETWHVEFDLDRDSGIDYTVGDAFGVFPTNDPALVDAVIDGARRAGRLSRSAAARCATC